MSAAVRIDGTAFSDPRFGLLGQLAGFNEHEALGRMARLWSICTDRNVAVLPVYYIIACLGDKGVDAIVTAGLGEARSDGILIKGTCGRIEWLAAKREAGKVGGQKSARKRADAKNKAPTKPRNGKKSSTLLEHTLGTPQAHLKHTSSTPQAHLEQNTSTPQAHPKQNSNRTQGSLNEFQPSSSFSSSSEKEEIHTQGSRDPSVPVQPYAIPDTWAPNQDHRIIAKTHNRDCDMEAERMRDWALANGKRRADWDSQFSGWLKNEQFEPKKQASAPRRHAPARSERCDPLALVMARVAELENESVAL